MKEDPKVSIVSVNYNQLSITRDFLESCRYLTYKNYEVILVDNNSNSDPTEEIASDFPEVKLLRSNKNLGFAGGNNLGIKEASGELIFMVNNDTELTPNILQPLLEIFVKFSDAAAVSPKFRYFYNKNTIEYAGYREVSLLTGKNSMIGCGEIDNGQYDEISKTKYVHGGGMMVLKSVIDKVGLMPEIYFLYYEEFDWCERIKKHGYNIYYQPNSIIYHKESMTTGKNSTLKTYYLTRNRILFMRRNREFFQFSVFIFYFAIITLPKNLLFNLFTLKFDHIYEFFKAIIWNLTNKKCVE